MIFRPDLVERILAGRKTVTRRLASDNPASPWWRERCGLTRGRDYAVCPGRGKCAVGRIRVTRAALEQLGWLNTLEARREGFAGVAAFMDAWIALHGRYDHTALVWRIEFEVLP